jgi:hypothetical protein
MHKIVALSAALLLTVTCPDYAEETHPIMLWGEFGTSSCASYLNAVKIHSSGMVSRSYQWHDAADVYLNWMDGFIAGAEVFSQQLAAHPIYVDGEGRDLWIRNWCQLNPAESFFQAVKAFVSEQGGVVVP